MAGLAAADAFTVESFFNGTHYTYVISIQEGIPVTLHMGDMPTDRPNGLKLSIAVKDQDMSEFYCQAKELYRYFTHKPNLNVDMDVSLPEGDVLSDKWLLRNDYGNANYVLMSQVIYAIPTSSDINNRDFTNVIILAEPGAVTFNPGRESLSLDRKTKDYLNQSFLELAEEFKDSAEAKMLQCTEDKEAYYTYKELCKVGPYNTMKNIQLVDYFSPELVALSVPSNRYYRTNNSNSAISIAMTPEFNTHIKCDTKLSYKPSHAAKSYVIESGSKTIGVEQFFKSTHVVVDLKTNFKTAINNAFNSKSVIVWQRSSAMDIAEFVRKITDTLDKMGISYILASSFVEKTAKKEVKTGLYVANISTGEYISRANTFVSPEDAKSKQYVYVKLKNSTPQLRNDTSINSLVGLYQAIRTQKDLPDIVGVIKKHQESVEKLDNWVELEDFLEKELTTLVFRMPSTTEVVTLNNKAINQDNYQSYPKAIQDLYIDTRDYFNFIKHKLCIKNPIIQSAAKKLGANLEYFEGTRGVDLARLENNYAASMFWIYGKEWYSALPDPKVIIDTAHKEEFYELHSTGGRHSDTSDS